MLAGTDYSRLFAWLGVLWLLIIVLGTAVWYYRRRWWRSMSGVSGDEQPWTLADLRQLRESGDLTEEEFQRIRSAMIAGLRPGGDKSEAVPKPPRTAKPL